MRRFFLYLSAITFCMIATEDLSASHAAGAELLYEFVSGNTYKFKFKFYRDCSGVNAPNSVQLCYKNNCNVINPNSINLPMVSGPVLVNGDCPNILTNCTSPNGLPSYQEFIYEGNITLTQACNSWRFWVNINARNPMNFLNSASNNVNLYVETVFNNTISAQDNSPIFNRLPVPYSCINTPFTYDNSASDANGDSLVYEAIMPRTHPTSNNCPTTPPVLCTYPLFTPPLNFTSNPLPCNNTFYINPSTGLFSIIPSQLGKGVIAIKVSQYRNGQLLGYIVRDIQTIVLNCNNSSPSVLLDSNSVSNCIVNNDTIAACGGNNFSFCFNTKTNNTSSILSIQSNLTGFTPPVSLVHYNVNTDSIYSCFNYTPSLADTGWHFLNLLIVDSICRPIGVLNTDTLTKIFSIYISPTNNTTIDTTICEPGIFAGYIQSGIYVDTFANKYGCDSIRTLNLTINPKTFSTENKTICTPTTYMGHTQSGVYYDTLVNQNGCDSIHTLQLLVLPLATINIMQTICQPDSFLGYNQSGTYIDTFTSSMGCDSIRTLNLIVNNQSVDTIVYSICEPNTYLGYSQSGKYIDTFSSSAGCDSIRVLLLTVYQKSFHSAAVNICAPGSYMGYSLSGTYIDTFVNSKGCDSINTLQLTITPVLQQLLNHTICAFDTYLGYNQSGTYIDTFYSWQGCDSIRTLSLIVIPIPLTTIFQTICAPNSFQGYSASGVYIDTFTSVANCDSIRTLNLIVQPVTTSYTTTVICGPNSYWGYNQSGIYIDTFVNSMGCDSIRTLDLTVNLFSNSYLNQTICAADTFLGYWQSGVYLDTFLNTLGCDSIRQLNLMVLPLTFQNIDTTICAPASLYGYSQTGVYVDTLLNSNGCELVRTIILTVPSPYYLDTTITICVGDSINYAGQVVKTVGIHWFKYQTTAGCDSLIKLNLILDPKPSPDLGLDVEICEGESITLFPGFFDKYLWWDGDTASHKIVSISGNYAVIVTNEFKCIGTDELKITVRPFPEVGIVMIDSGWCIGKTITLMATGATNYVWHGLIPFRGQIGNSNPISIKTELNYYRFLVIGWDNIGCKDSASIDVYPVECCGKILIPNAFSPNGDGLNDRYGLIKTPDAQSFQMRIFNRWGQCVFKSSSFDDKWDGTYKEEICPVGTYFYIIDSKCYSEKTSRFFTGDITLIR